ARGDRLVVGARPRRSQGAVPHARLAVQPPALLGRAVPGAAHAGRRRAGARRAAAGRAADDGRLRARRHAGIAAAPRHGLVRDKEPFRKLYNQGMIQSFAYEDARGAVVPTALVAEDGERFVHQDTREPLQRIVTKMSKRYGNVVNPDEVVKEYGADTLRL